jgi:hypothetical protein
VLVGVVVLSMALTPYLASLGEYVGDYVEKLEKARAKSGASDNTPIESFSAGEKEDLSNAVVIWYVHFASPTYSCISHS